MKRQRAKMIVKLLYSYDGQMYEMRAERGHTLAIEGVTDEEIYDVEAIYAALDWSGLGPLAEAARQLLGRKDLLNPARHERKVRR